MATNIKYLFGPCITLSVAATDPTTPASGDPLRLGEICGVAERDEDAAGNATANFGPVAATLSVKGVDGSGNSAVALGDKLYYVDADTPKISKKATGHFFGYALGTVGSGSTASIDVLIKGA